MAIEGIYFGNNTITTSTAIKGKDASELDMNDFFNLLVAQMTNQDMMNPVNDTEFIAQMAQFSALQGIQTIQEYQLSSYAASYVGKYVTIAHQTESGSIETLNGQVESVTYYDGAPKVVVNGKSYDLFTVMEINAQENSGSLNEANSYIGKTVTVEYTNDDDEDILITGVVTGVSVKDGGICVVINGKEHPFAAITSVE